MRARAATGLDSLDALVERVGRAGLPVRLQVEGDAVPLPRAVDLSAYRIVQEGLTNSLKHAKASRADVTVRYGSEDELEVRDDGVGASSSDGLGHGLVIRNGSRSTVVRCLPDHVRRAVSCSPPASRWKAAGMSIPRACGRRPVDGPRRLPHVALRRGRHRGRRRGE